MNQFTADSTSARQPSLVRMLLATCLLYLSLLAGVLIANAHRVRHLGIGDSLDMHLGPFALVRAQKSLYSSQGYGISFALRPGCLLLLTGLIVLALLLYVVLIGRKRSAV